jgi:hypothetical protein
MLIKEFYTKFASIQEKSRLFKALRRLSRLERGALLTSETEPQGWAQWPPIATDDPGVRLGRV